MTIFRKKNINDYMDLHEERKGKATIITLSGRLDSSSSPEVEKKIVSTIVQGNKDIVLDFGSLDYISSAGIRVLVLCNKEVEKLKGHIYLASVPKTIENVLYITGFLQHFRLFEGQNQALEELEKLEDDNS
ncbi:MAG: STAS domain-containing protein [Chlamydiales bacterium]